MKERPGDLQGGLISEGILRFEGIQLRHLELARIDLGGKGGAAAVDEEESRQHVICRERKGDESISLRIIHVQINAPSSLTT